MNGVWVLYDQWHEEIKEYYDCEETAWLAYCKWCETHDENPDGETFEDNYVPLTDVLTIITDADVKKDEFIPAQKRRE